AVNDEKLSSLVRAAQTMADGFMNSTLGQKAISSSFIKTEYPVITTLEDKQGRFIVSGQIDLLFNDGDVIYIVDFKTDREEDSARYTGQLAIYKQAVEDIFGKPVECRLFYLRNGHEVNMTREINETNVEERFRRIKEVPYASLQRSFSLP
ncbi:MAG: PD-(D/E)XK nuclease family protein, partial [Treponema sp.]|nr:PD-(D/E)XK nuclease family protein [Treponema sp.]